MDIPGYNREAWTREVAAGNRWTRPVGPEDVAAAGAMVTVFDNCPAQLEAHRAVAERERFEILIARGDMADLGLFGDGTFVRGGPNGRISLTEARANYRRMGASQERRAWNVRPPRAEELPGHSS